MKIVCSSRFAMLALLLVGQVSAATINYSATLSAANEVPAITTSSAFGFATLSLTGNSLFVYEYFSGLTGGPAAAGHIHCCAMPGSNAPVAVPFVGFPAATSGVYTATFDLSTAAVYTSAFLSANGGTAATAEAALITGLNSNLTYVNIHDGVYPGGEIRGFITQTPEPGTAATAGLLLLLGLPLALRKLKQGVV